MNIYTFTNGDVSVIIYEVDEEYARELLNETVIDTESFWLEEVEKENKDSTFHN